MTAWQRRIPYLAAVLLAVIAGGGGGQVPDALRSFRDGDVPLDFYDDLRNRLLSANYSETAEGSAVVRVLDRIRLCQITSLFPITTRKIIKSTGEMEIQPLEWNLYYEAAILLAVKHFNDRSSAIVGGLSERLNACNLYLTVELRDTQYSQMESSRQLLESVLVKNHNLTTPLPMAIVGAKRSVISLPVGILAGAYEIPQISAFSTSSQLDNRDVAPYFARTIPTNVGDAKALVLYLSQLQVKYFAVAYPRDPYGSEYFSDLVLAAKHYNISVKGATYETSRLNQTLDPMIQRLQDSQMRYFVGIFYDTHYKEIFKKLCSAGIAGNAKHVWFFTDSLLFMVQEGFELNKAKDEQVAKVINGSGLVYLKVTANQVLNQGVKDFMMDKDTQQYFISRHVEEEIFQNISLDNMSARISSFNTMLYDSIMSFGIAACEVKEEFFSAADLYQQLKETKFTGASGDVEFTESATRKDETVSFQIVNMVQQGQEDSGDNVIQFKATQAVLVDKTVLHVQTPFIFFDGTSNRPPELAPAQVDMNLIGIGIRIMGWTMAGIVVIMSVIWMVWAIYNRKKPVIRASQPIFLCMLCSGTLVMASSIIPSSLQEPISQRGLDIACQSAPWLFSLGWVTSFSALFSKAYRLNKIFQQSREYRRVQIRARDVMLPFISLLIMNSAILITQTIVAPLRWVRKPVSNFDDFDRSIESYGWCQSTNQNDSRMADYIFFSLMIGVNVVALLFAIYQTWKSRHLPPSNYSESWYISISFRSMFEALVLAIPAFFVVQENPSGNFAVTSIFVTAACIAILLPIFVPKYHKRNEVVKNKRSARRSVSIVTTRRAYAEALALEENATSRERHNASLDDMDQGRPLMVANHNID